MDWPRRAPGGAVVFLVWLGLLACSSGPFGNAVQDPKQLISKASDVPADLHQCQGSGPIDGYLAALKPSNQQAYQSLNDTWTELKKEGARSAAVSVFTTSPSGCTARLGAAPGRSVANLVAVFPDERAAADAYRRGIFGFPTPAAGAQIPGVSKGVATGLSDNAWVAQRDVGGRSLYVAWWQDRPVAAFLVAADLDASESMRAALAVERRIR
jgi:hypothetical protein